MENSLALHREGIHYDVQDSWLVAVVRFGLLSASALSQHDRDQLAAMLAAINPSLRILLVFGPHDRDFTLGRILTKASESSAGLFLFLNEPSEVLQKLDWYWEGLAVEVEDLSDFLNRECISLPA